MAINQPNLVDTSFKLSRRKFSVLSHVKNIDYCIENIESASKDGPRYVVGYNKDGLIIDSNLGNRL